MNRFLRPGSPVCPCVLRPLRRGPDPPPGEVPGPHGEPPGEKGRLRLQEALRGLPPEVLLTAVTKEGWRRGVATSRGFTCASVPGTSPCVRPRGPTGPASCPTASPRWSSTWATSRRSTRWAGGGLHPGPGPVSVWSWSWSGLSVVLVL